MSRVGARRRRLWILCAGVPLALVAVAGVAFLVLSRTDADRVPPGLTIAGVPVGGLTFGDARRRLNDAILERLSAPIVLVLGETEFETSGLELGATADIEAALQDASRGRGRLSLVAARLGLADEIQIALAYRVAADPLDEVLDRLARVVERAPRPARVEYVGDEAVVLAAVTGQRLRREEAASILRSLPGRATVPTRPVEPRISDADAARAKAAADGLLLNPPEVVRGDEQRAVLSPEILRRAIRFKSRKARGTIAVVVDPIALERPLEKVFGEIEREPREASFEVLGTKVRVVPARKGRRIDTERIARELVANSSATEIPVRFAVQRPSLSTRDAAELRIEELVSEFTTEFACCEPRVANIRLAARMLDSTILRPGGRFSLNESLGRRTRKRGFVPAPTIYDGRLRDDVGGGISQLATTLYNAAFFAGLELVTHSPHQFYISRYPMGREATVSWGGPELVFRNDWKAGLLMRFTTTATSITVRFYSAKLGRRIVTETGVPYDYRAPSTIRELNTELPPGVESVIQEGSVSGFSVDYTREVYRGKTRLRNERYHVEYDPKDTIIEYGPEPAGTPAGG